jgi:hypothetical protein
MTVGAATHFSVASTIAFTEPNGSYGYSVNSIDGYTPTPVSGTATVSGAPDTIEIAFTANPPGKYMVSFMETGLGIGTTWNVTLGGTVVSTSVSTVSFAVVNGTYSYVVGSVVGYTGLPESGNVTVSGAAVSVSITFTAISSSTYPVTFRETGLASGATWNVVLDGVSNIAMGPNAIVFSSIADGLYYFETGAAGYAAIPFSGSITVQGAPASESISFAPNADAGPAYNVTFNETGLPGGTGWELSCGISTSAVFAVSTEGSSVEFAIPNGTYEWDVAILSMFSSYVATPNGGNITVSGVPVVQEVNFMPMGPSTTNYTVTFTEQGLPAGVTWQVDLNGSTFMSNSTALIFSEPNGTYEFDSISLPAGDAVNPASGAVSVDGAPVTVALHFGTAYSVTFSWSGASGDGCFWVVTLNGSEQFGECGSSLSLSVPNGTYDFTVLVYAGDLYPTPAAGTLMVAGASVTEPITFTQLPYTVTFTETGLPALDYWEAILFTSLSEEAAALNESGTAIVLAVQNGSYSWLAAAFSGPLNVSGFLASPGFGSVLVNGHDVNVTVTFVRASGVYPVEFFEGQVLDPMDGGLPTGAVWSVTLNGTTQSTSGLLILFYEPNGTYNFTVTPPTGYVAAPGSGTFTVDENSTLDPFGGPGAFVYFGPTGSPLTTWHSVSGTLPAPGPGEAESHLPLTSAAVPLSSTANQAVMAWLRTSPWP